MHMEASLTVRLGVAAGAHAKVLRLSILLFAFIMPEACIYRKSRQL
jgi:hypothetical protein